MIVLSSSLAYCCEREDLCAEDKSTSCENEKPLKHQENFPCSPFFECGSCTGNILIDSPLVFQNINLKLQPTFSTFIEKKRRKDLNFRLLKPPKQIL